MQNYCSRLIHYEIPWNPNRIEQRNGRVDRHGQQANEVQIYHFVGKNYQGQTTSGSRPGELEGDLEVLMRAALKVNNIREDCRFHDPIESADDIATLRSLYIKMDQAVAIAYGWQDLNLEHDFH